jgi:hypothetical protein
MRLFIDGEDKDGQALRTGPVPLAAKPFDVPMATLTRYVGGYSAPMGAVTIAEAGEGRLTIQLAGQRALALRATGLADFNVEHVGAKVHFVEADAKVVRLDMAQRGRTLPAIRN